MESPTRIWQVTISDRSKFGTPQAKYQVLMGLAQTAADAANRALKAATDGMGVARVVQHLYVSAVQDMGKADF